MGVYLLVGACWCLCAAPQERLLQQLDEDFEAILKTEKNPQPLRQAAKLLHQTNQSDHWTDYTKAVALLRQSRSKAGIPLLLKYLVLHAGYSTGHVVIPTYADTLAILTGKDIENPYRYQPDRKTPVREAVETMVKKWWNPDKDRLSTDQGQMSRAQLQIIVQRILGNAKKVQAHDYPSKTPDQLSYTVAALFPPHRAGNRITYWKEDFHPSMVPLLLEQAGYQGRAGEKPQKRDTVVISFPVISILAMLRRDGEAKELGQIAGDQRQSSATRLTCLLALASAGEDLNTPTLLEVLAAEEKVERRIVGILALAHAKQQKVAVPVLLRMLDHPNRDVRVAAVLGMRNARPIEALPKLQKLLNEDDPSTPVYRIVELLARIPAKESQKILADYLRVQLKEDKRGNNLYHALYAFETATEQQWIEAGAHPNSYYRDLARKALDWWDKKNK